MKHQMNTWPQTQVIVNVHALTPPRSTAWTKLHNPKWAEGTLFMNKLKNGTFTAHGYISYRIPAPPGGMNVNAVEKLPVTRIADPIRWIINFLKHRPEFEITQSSPFTNPNANKSKNQIQNAAIRRLKRAGLGKMVVNHVASPYTTTGKRLLLKNFGAMQKMLNNRHVA